MTTDVGTRAVALVEAVKVVGDQGAEAVLAAAKSFDDFLAGTAAAPSKAVVSVAGKEPAAPAKPTKGTVSKAKPAKAAAPAPEPELPDEPETEEESEGEEADSAELSGEEGVKAVIALALDANLRKEVVTTLKKYKAASATSVKPKDYAAFIADIQKLLPAVETESEEDLTA